MGWSAVQTIDQLAYGVGKKNVDMINVFVFSLLHLELAVICIKIFDLNA